MNPTETTQLPAGQQVKSPPNPANNTSTGQAFKATETARQKRVAALDNTGKTSTVPLAEPEPEPEIETVAAATVGGGEGKQSDKVDVLIQEILGLCTSVTSTKWNSLKLFGNQTKINSALNKLCKALSVEVSTLIFCKRHASSGSSPCIEIFSSNLLHKKLTILDIEQVGAVGGVGLSRDPRLEASVMPGLRSIAPAAAAEPKSDEKLATPSLKELHATLSKISTRSKDFRLHELSQGLIDDSRQMKRDTWDHIVTDSETRKYTYDPGLGKYRYAVKSVDHDFQCAGQESTFLQVRNLVVDKDTGEIAKDSTPLDKTHLENSDILLVHQGGTKGGHYVTCVKASEDQWVVYVDEYVFPFPDFNTLESHFAKIGHPLNQNVVSIGQTPSRKTVEELKRAGGILNPNQYCFQIAALQVLRAMPFSQRLNAINVDKAAKTFTVHVDFHPVPIREDFETFFIGDETSESSFDLLKKALHGTPSSNDLVRLLESTQMFEKDTANQRPPFIRQQDSFEFLTKIFGFFTDFPLATLVGLVPQNFSEIRDFGGNIIQHNLPKIEASTASSLTVRNGSDSTGFKYTEERRVSPKDEVLNDLVHALGIEPGLYAKEALFPHLQMLKVLKEDFHQDIADLKNKINPFGDNQALTLAIIDTMLALPQTPNKAALENFFVSIASEEMLDLYLTKKYPQHKPEQYDETLALIKGFTNPDSKLVALRTFALTLLNTPAPVEVQAAQKSPLLNETWVSFVRDSVESLISSKNLEPEPEPENNVAQLIQTFLKLSDKWVMDESGGIHVSLSLKTNVIDPFFTREDMRHTLTKLCKALHVSSISSAFRYRSSISSHLQVPFYEIFKNNELYETLKQGIGTEGNFDMAAAQRAAAVQRKAALQREAAERAAAPQKAAERVKREAQLKKEAAEWKANWEAAKKRDAIKAAEERKKAIELFTIGSWDPKRFASSYKLVDGLTKGITFQSCPETTIALAKVVLINKPSQTLTRTLTATEGKDFWALTIPDELNLTRIDSAENIHIHQLVLTDVNGTEKIAKVAVNHDGSLVLMNPCGEVMIHKKQIDSFLARKPVIYVYGYPPEKMIRSTVSLNSEQRFYELIPGFNDSINITTASLAELKQLPGIGHRLAAKIIAYREQYTLSDVTDLLNVDGIGPITLSNITPFVGCDDSLNHWCVYPSKNQDGSVIDAKTGKHYPYLFWESSFTGDIFTCNRQNAFCIKKDTLRSFLNEKLGILGLIEHEKREFIDFWHEILTAPKLDMYHYVRVEFLEETYTEKAVLHIDPKPDKVIRVFAHFQLATHYEECGNPTLTAVKRCKNSKVIVEWGGTERVPDETSINSRVSVIQTQAMT